MSAALRRERAWRYVSVETTNDDATTGTTWTLDRANTPDGARWVAVAPQEGRESTVALRRTAILRAVFTIDDNEPVADTDLWRWQRTGILYNVTGIREVPTLSARVTVFDAESVERGQYAITEDVPEHTAATVIIAPAVLNVTVGTVRRFTASVTNNEGVVLQDRPVVWGSSDRNVFNIDAQGRGEAFSPGVVTITATSGAAVGEATVTVAAD